jgi:hypothetical protein
VPSDLHHEWTLPWCTPVPTTGTVRSAVRSRPCSLPSTSVPGLAQSNGQGLPAAASHKEKTLDGHASLRVGQQAMICGRKSEGDVSSTRELLVVGQVDKPTRLAQRQLDVEGAVRVAHIGMQVSAPRSHRETGDLVADRSRKQDLGARLGRDDAQGGCTSYRFSSG